ncbi:Guanine nucleotide-binding protein G(q) subunit alpha [Hypsibius exemplaris]|uniref:Guanine nucleotide-binding protein G(Q) subunit alpha n=1 Tax=Hypsibius exemplaris TaxID=2072580 RepID=A0A1W0XDG3_HYPEX|nr:Guanine nucleotide-binding protein G(q) subunit alpha [Hypsibius exemplaris]
MGQPFQSVNCCPCVIDEDEKAARKVSRKIGREMEKEEKRRRRVVKILLLGTKEAGKSTVLKQMRIIHSKDFEDEESRLPFVDTIRKNVIEATQILLRNMERLGMSPEDDRNRSHNVPVFIKEAVLTMFSTDPVSILALFSSILAIWEDQGIQACFHRRAEFRYDYLNDSSQYFLNRIAAIADPKYVPTEQDVLRARQCTAGVQQYSFDFRGVPFRVMDVGGLRSERRKWIHCFEDVTSVLFVAALSDYDKYLLDKKDNRAVNLLEESLALFKVVISNHCLQTAALILYLNKTDIFADKLMERDLTDHFPDYVGERGNSDPARLFILSKYKDIALSHLESSPGGDIRRALWSSRSQRSQEERLLYTHFTCATDNENIAFATAAVQDHLMQAALKDFHFA